MLHQSCCPPATFRNPKRDTGCFEGLNDLLKDIAESVRIDGVVLAYRYRPKDWQHVQPSLPLLPSLFSKVVLLGVSPVFSKTVPEWIAETGSIPYHIEADDPHMIPWDFAELAAKARAMSEGYGVDFVDTRDFHKRGNHYPLWVGNDFTKPIYWDEIHLTRHSIPLFASYLKSKRELKWLAG